MNMPRPIRAGAVPTLQLVNVSAGYGPFRAIFDVSFTHPARFGARAARLQRRGQDDDRPGVLRADPADRRCGAAAQREDVTKARPSHYAKQGVVHAPEGRSVFASLTVEENLELTFRRSRGRAGVRAALDEAYALFPRHRRTAHAARGHAVGR